MQVKVSHSAGTKFKVNVENHEFFVDQPLSDGGTDSGPTPPALLLSSLASCVGVYCYFFCKNHNIDPAGLEIIADYKIAEKPRRIAQFTLNITPPKDLPGKDEKKFIKYSESCLITKTLLNEAEIVTVLNKK